MATFATKTDIDSIHNKISDHVAREEINDMKVDFKGFVSHAQLEDVISEIPIIKKEMSRFVKNEDVLLRIDLIGQEFREKLLDKVNIK